MDKVATINPTLWKPPVESRRIFDAVGHDSVRFVGGFVRNALLEQPVSDPDMATIHTPDEVTKRLVSAGITIVPTGIEHGTVTAVVDGKPFEITTLRRDVKTDGRHAVVAFSTDWAEDARRRDFTMNTLLADLDGNVFDPLGRGIADLKAGRVVFVGEPAQRIAEDYLRILRFYRFQALYGRGFPDAAAIDACQQAAAKISTLSRERITQEMRKIIAIDDPAGILETMRAGEIMPELFHPAYRPESMKALSRLQREHDALMVEARLYILSGGDENHRAALDKYLLFSKEQAKNLAALFIAVAMPCGVKERLYRFGRVIALQSILIMAAMEDVVPDVEILDLLFNWKIPVMPVNGDDVRAGGIVPGPAMGEILRDVEKWWIGESFTPDRTQLLEIVNELICAKGASKI